MFIFQLKLLIHMCDIYNAGPPTCQTLEIAGLPVEGQRLSFNAAYSGGCDSQKYTFVVDTKAFLLLTCSLNAGREEIVITSGLGLITIQ